MHNGSISTGEPHRFCIQCRKPITPGQPWVIWPPVDTQRLIHVAYHEPCVPASIRRIIANIVRS